MNCPRCSAMFYTPPVISRKDNQTPICSDCGLLEGLEAAGIKAPYRGPQYWTGDRCRTGDGMVRPGRRSD